VPGPRPRPALARVLFLSAFAIATCGLIYELIAGSMASYLLGDSVTQFSLIIGAYLSAMGVGSWLSRYVERDLLGRFVEIEVAVGLIGGFGAMMLFGAFTYASSFRVALFAHVGLVGTLVGLELPLLLRILKEDTSLKELVARVLFLDYFGALAASLAFPLLLVPRLGLFRTGLVFGLVNAGVALWATFLFDDQRPNTTRLRLLSAGAVVVLALGLPVAGDIEQSMEHDLFADPVVLREVTPYQRIVVTHAAGETRLFLDGALQLASSDEYRYHEALVHPALAAHQGPARRVLILGGGDGMAAREALRWQEVEQVTLVDLDPAVTDLFSRREELAALNGGALTDPRVDVVNADAFVWLQQEQEPHDVAIIDFPDPNDYGVGKLYTTHFYRLLRSVLAPGATIGIQATSAFFSPDAFWCIARTVEHEGFSVRPYHAYVPSFGEWGFLLASADRRLEGFRGLPSELRFLNDETVPGLFVFPDDMRRRDGPVNRLNNQVLVRIYEEDWLDLWD